MNHLLSFGLWAEESLRMEREAGDFVISQCRVDAAWDTPVSGYACLDLLKRGPA